MSAEARAAISDAASTVTGVNCKPYYRQSLKSGDAFVRLARRAPDPSGLGDTVVWQVWLALPQDVLAAEKWLDERVGDLYAALRGEMTITSITPAELVLGGTNSVNGVIVEGAREGL